MAGTRIGGLKAKEKNLANDPNFYAKIGAKGGANGHSGGFATDVYCDCNVIAGDHVKRQCAGRKGGMKSRRTKNK